MIPWVILLRMDIFSALCDPWGSCDDTDQSVAGGEAAWGGSGWGGSCPKNARNPVDASYRINMTVSKGTTRCIKGRTQLENCQTT